MSINEKKDKEEWHRQDNLIQSLEKENQKLKAQLEVAMEVLTRYACVELLYDDDNIWAKDAIKKIEEIK